MKIEVCRVHLYSMLLWFLLASCGANNGTREEIPLPPEEEEGNGNLVDGTYNELYTGKELDQ